MLHDIFFFVLSVLGIASGVGMLLNRNPVYCLLMLVVNFFCIGGLFLILHAEFLAAIQIIVYAGAIMVLFLFVIMLLNLEVEAREEHHWDLRRISGFVLGLIFLMELLYTFSDIQQFSSAEEQIANFKYGKVEPIGKALMTDYLFPFEMISVILLAALIGAIVIAKKHK
ncbi:MAG: NADH-quinone oxidoreductase subunit J [Bacteroidia bacterium]|nr:NADH-quinone oxidoreductase subunit J [Bacteroidia bacterium]MDW8158346.1 NADH-quinone oxidoreductase subunit J [Bacteroidia bacterium]